MTNSADFNAASRDDRTTDSVISVETGDKVWRNAKSQPHLTDGSAIEGTDGYKAWRVNGQLQRTDGPEIKRADGHKFWIVNGKELTEQEFNAHPLAQEARHQKEKTEKTDIAARSRLLRAMLKLTR